MLNQGHALPSFVMAPDGSLNRLPIDSLRLHKDDPLLGEPGLTGFDVVSSRALSELLKTLNPVKDQSLREFLSSFNARNSAHQTVLTLFSHRFSAVIIAARTLQNWGQHTQFLNTLGAYWKSVETVVISGGLSSNDFGIELATRSEPLCGVQVIASPWAGSTALVGMAQHVSQAEALLVMDFGGTGIKRAISTRYGNRLTPLPELRTADFKYNGKITAQSFREILLKTAEHIGEALPVAISVACYLENGHPFKYASGVYFDIATNEAHFETALKTQWLPEAGLGELKRLVHDSSAAALAFRFKAPAMMVTLGTGLGSAPCPLVDI